MNGLYTAYIILHGPKDEYQVIVSNGLNIYEPDDLKVTQLYQEFYTALKSSGIFISDTRPVRESWL